ncbi:MAG TPA: hypothetical protein VIS10_08060 [Anaerolineales bacterium]
MRRYRHTFTVKANKQAVADFHSHSSSMASITPPPVIVQMHKAPENLGENSEMEFTLWLGFLPIRWLASIEDISPTGFTDRQIRGPFKEWSHRHTYIPIDEKHTEIIDEISYSFKEDLYWGLIGWGMATSLPLLFAYRAWKTRRILKS